MLVHEQYCAGNGRKISGVTDQPLGMHDQVQRALPPRSRPKPPPPRTWLATLLCPQAWLRSEVLGLVAIHVQPPCALSLDLCPQPFTPPPQPPHHYPNLRSNCCAGSEGGSRELVRTASGQPILRPCDEVSILHRAWRQTLGVQRLAYWQAWLLHLVMLT